MLTPLGTGRVAVVLQPDRLLQRVLLVRRRLVVVAAEIQRRSDPVAGQQHLADGLGVAAFAGIPERRTPEIDEEGFATRRSQPSWIGCSLMFSMTEQAKPSSIAFWCAARVAVALSRRTTWEPLTGSGEGVGRRIAFMIDFGKIVSRP